MAKSKYSSFKGRIGGVVEGRRKSPLNGSSVFCPRLVLEEEKTARDVQVSDQIDLLMPKGIVGR